MVTGLIPDLLSEITWSRGETYHRCRDFPANTDIGGMNSMSTRRPQRLSCRVQDQTAIVCLNDMEIWDGADLSKLREVLTQMIIKDGYRSVGVDLSTVKYIPSGFFGMLYEWYESGVEVTLCSPRRHVAAFRPRTGHGETPEPLTAHLACRADPSALSWHIHAAKDFQTPRNIARHVLNARANFLNCQHARRRISTLQPFGTA